MNNELSGPSLLADCQTSLTQESPATGLSIDLPATAQSQLLRMFRDPSVLEREERKDLVRQLKEAVALRPAVAELRVLLGMALCVDLNGQAALDELRNAALLNPDSYVARLKLGELLMRLRICAEAAEETHCAARLAATPLQAELARRQASNIRSMQREGIERGVYSKFWSGLTRRMQWSSDSEPRETPVALSLR